MKLLAQLPPDRESEGRFTALDGGGAPIFGPYRCRGEADNAGALANGNMIEDPTQAFGDHPYGVYRVVQVLPDPRPVDSYGPFFIRLSPVSGEALEAWHNGRRGLGIHGGQLGPGRTLRATFGCLRLDNETLEQLAKSLIAERAELREVFYECRPLTP